MLPAEPSVTRARVSARSARALMLSSRFDAAVDRAREAEETAHAVGAVVEEAIAATVRFTSLAFRGEIDEAITRMHAARELGRPSPHPRSSRGGSATPCPCSRPGHDMMRRSR